MKYENALLDIIKSDRNYVVLTAENRAAIRNLPKQTKGQFFDTGITEQTMIGLSAGMALRGRIPVVHALAAFLTMRAFEFIRTDIGLPNLPVKLVGSFSGFLSEANGPTHQAIEDISLMRGIPNMNIFCPADEIELAKGLADVLKYPEPFYIRYNNSKCIIVHENFEIGKAEVHGKGRDVAILVYGMLFNQAYLAKELLESSGIHVRLINLRTLKPLDEKVILRAVEECELIVTIEDHFLTGGLFSILAELLLTNKRTANVLPFSLKHRWFKPGLLNDVIEYEGFSGPQLAERIEDFLTTNKKIKYYAEWSNV